MAGPNWRQVLDAARRLAKRDVRQGGGGGFTSGDLALEAGIQPGKKSTAIQIASAWCGKLKKWGYIASSVNDTDGVRWCRLWQLTAKGEDRKKRRGRAAGP